MSETVEAKKVVDMIDANIGFNPEAQKTLLYGIPINHPRDYLNGRLLATSEVIKVDGNRIETKNTIYNVKSWYELPIR